MRRVVITGMGIVSSIGNNTQEVLSSLHEARSGITRAGKYAELGFRWFGSDEGVLYADFRDAFKPAAIDFGPDYTPDILNPETAKSYEIGLKGAAADWILTYDFDVFLQNFQMQVGVVVELFQDAFPVARLNQRVQVTILFTVRLVDWQSSIAFQLSNRDRSFRALAQKRHQLTIYFVNFLAPIFDVHK